jgi:NADPH:quinone reductase-like Zn-dependent oxidoreductase
MNAAVVARFGPPECLEFREMPVPIPQPGQIRIRVRAIGLNFADVMARLGLYPAIPKPPFIPGIEVSGEVDEVGPGVTAWKPGDRVSAFTPLGAYAEYVCTPAAFVVPLPPGRSWVEGASLMVSALTAYHGLVTLATLRKSEKVLVHAAAGGVGIAVLQLAKHLGAETIATAGSAAKLEVALAHGADHVINYRDEDFEAVTRSLTGGYGVDVVMDSVGGTVFRKGWRLVAPMGRYILYGFAAVSGKRRVDWFHGIRELLAMPLILPHVLMPRNISLHCFNLFFLTHKTDYVTFALSELTRLDREGAVRPVVGATFPFARLADAQAFQQGRSSHGKVVLEL